MKIIITESQYQIIKFNLLEEFANSQTNAIIDPSMNKHNVEMVTIFPRDKYYWNLSDAIGEDRNLKPIMMNGENYSEKNISKLMQDISMNGFKEPIIMAFDYDSGYASIIEGNHRVEAAIRLGYKEVPVQVEKMRIRSDFEREKDNMFPLKKNMHGKVPNVKVASDLGYKGRPVNSQDIKNINSQNTI